MTLYSQYFLFLSVLACVLLLPLPVWLFGLATTLTIVLSFVGALWSFSFLLEPSPWLLITEHWSLLGLELSWRVNLWSATFLTLIFTVGTLVLVYSQFYFDSNLDRRRVTALLTLFQMAMVGLVCSTNLIALFIFWELTTVISFLLISFQHTEEKARKAALRALTVTGIGGFGLLWFVGWIGTQSGLWDLILLEQSSVDWESLPGFYFALLGLVLAAMTKSAQIPFHFWLPGAMAAPTPISSYLHSATMVKAGLFLLGATQFLWMDLDRLTTFFSVIGMITALWGLWVASLQQDLKNLFAWTTVSALGMILVSISLDQPLLKNSSLLLLGHGFYKAAGFFWVGHIDHEHGSRQIDQLSTSKQWRWIEKIVLIVIVLAIAGLPPGLSGTAKSLAFGSGLTPIIFLFLLSFLSGLIVYKLLSPFLRAPLAEKSQIKNRFLPLVSLAGLLIVSETVLAFTLQHFFSEKQLGVTTIKYVGLFSGVFAADWILVHLQKRFLRFNLLSFSEKYDALLSGLLNKALILTRKIFDLSPTTQMRILWVGIVGLTVMVFEPWEVPLEGVSLAANQAGWLLQGGLLTCLAVIGLFWARSWWAALLMLGGVGLGVTLVFGFLGAPDLALTQLLVEAITLVLILSLLKSLPRWDQGSSLTWRTHLLAGTIAGLSFVVLVSMGLTTLRHPWAESVGQLHTKYSWSEADGLNVVNVILVDFRGFDTLGEITVLVIAAIAILSAKKTYFQKREQE